MHLFSLETYYNSNGLNIKLYIILKGHSINAEREDAFIPLKSEKTRNIK